jgi:hypothetical protein
MNNKTDFNTVGKSDTLINCAALWLNYNYGHLGHSSTLAIRKVFV